MKTTRIIAVLLITLSLLLSWAVPLSTSAEELDITKYGLGLVPSEGDFPQFDSTGLAPMLQALPAQVDLSAGLPPIGNQGYQSSCVGWAVGYYYKTFQERAERSWSVTTSEHQFSPAWVYNQRTISDCSRDTGMSFYGAFQILRDKGAATLAAFPYNVSDPCTQPSATVKQDALQYRASSFSNLFAGAGSANIDTLKALLASGKTFVLAVPVYSSFYRITSANPVLPRHASTETFYGGHAMFVVGYDDTLGGFKTANSWGASWGRNGFCYLSYDFVRYDCWEGWVMEDQLQPVQPTTHSTFQGNVTVTGAPIAPGTTVSAWISDTQVAQTTISLSNGSSTYSIEIPSDDPATATREGGREDEAVRFKVGSAWAPETGSWKSETVNDLNLTAAVNYCIDPALWITKFGSATGGWVNQDTNPRFLADVNGDRKADIVGFANDGVYVALSTGSGFAAPSRWLANMTAGVGGWTSQDKFPRALADVNGDGKADIIGFGNAGVYVALSTGARFNNPVLWLRNYGYMAGGYKSQNLSPRFLADVNGDRKADIVAFNTVGIYVSLSTGRSFAAPVLWTRNYNTASGGWTSQDTMPRAVADVNGDGKADIVGFGPNGVNVSLSTGRGFAAPLLWINGFGANVGAWTSQTLDPRMLADMNGDGKADVVGFQDDGVYVALSSGQGFGAPFLWSNAFGSATPAWASQTLSPRLAADVTGDARADLVGFGPGGVYVARANAMALSVAEAAGGEWIVP